MAVSLLQYKDELCRAAYKHAGHGEGISNQATPAQQQKPEHLLTAAGLPKAGQGHLPMRRPQSSAELSLRRVSQRYGCYTAAVSHNQMFDVFNVHHYWAKRPRSTSNSHGTVTSILCCIIHFSNQIKIKNHQPYMNKQLCRWEDNFLEYQKD